jgi:hypothetical protein
MRNAFYVGALTLALGLPAIGEDIPKDQAGFTDFAAHQLRVELGEATVVIQSPLTLKLKPLMEVAKVAVTGSIGQLIGDSFNPSRLALIDTWAPLAEAQGGKLIAVAPASDAVFYVSDDSPVAINALRTLARNIMSQAPHPLSEVLLRWKPTGWEVVR